MAAPAKASKNYNLQFIQGVAGDEFYITMNCGMQAEACQAGGIGENPRRSEVRPHGAKADSRLGGRRQAGRHPHCTHGCDGYASTPQLSKCVRESRSSSSIPTVKDPSIAVSAIASDNEGGGKAAFEAIKQLNPNGGKVMVMGVNPGISTTDARTKGFEEAVKQIQSSSTSGSNTPRMIRQLRLI
jgi:ribose transport system substrate-binding protein